jgi:hypothetical protein
LHHPELRTVPRFFLNPPLQGFAGGRAVRVVDLCVKGARLEHTLPFTPGTDINLAILGSDREITMKATVLWCELDSLQLSVAHDRYLTGIAFRNFNHSVGELIEDLSGVHGVIRIEDERNFDRYRVSVPLTASFGELSPVSLLDLSLRGAKIETGRGIEKGMTGQLIFQVDADTGPVAAMGEVVWIRPTIDGAFHAGVQIAGHDEVMADAIHRLCRSGEAHIDLNALRRKFDALRAESLAAIKAGAA